jgi:hypothetical protein
MGMFEELGVAAVDWDIVASRIRLLLYFEDAMRGGIREFEFC